ncbi:hypothetical protein NQ176_g826 [Zarea fungicola]|uniref:Uncharacterized protein n=1 Tax=Zarea fungicola TaxID=93591 RepID=A0ACC1NWI6_9HYPO|nr:hypothetical protein NQ176_g826 [Lecanicillium fungicola]
MEQVDERIVGGNMCDITVGGKRLVCHVSPGRPVQDVLVDIVSMESVHEGITVFAVVGVGLGLSADTYHKFKWRECVVFKLIGNVFVKVLLRQCECLVLGEEHGPSALEEPERVGIYRHVENGFQKNEPCMLCGNSVFLSNIFF